MKALRLHILALIPLMATLCQGCSEWGDDSADISKFVGSWRCAYNDSWWYKVEDLTINEDRSYSKSTEFYIKADSDIHTDYESGLIWVNGSNTEIIFREESRTQHIYTVDSLTSTVMVLRNSAGQVFQYVNLISNK